MEAQTSRLAQARDWYLKAVDDVPDSGWDKPSLCEGWSARHVVAHVATGDKLVRGLLLDALGRVRSGQDLPVDFADRQRMIQEALTWEPAKLREAAHSAADQSVALIAETAEKAPDTVITMPFGVSPMPVLKALRLNEYIIHAHDLSPAAASAPLVDVSSSQKWASAIEISGSHTVMMASTGASRMPCWKAFWLSRKPSGPTMARA